MVGGFAFVYILKQRQALASLEVIGYTDNTGAIHGDGPLTFSQV